MGAVQNADPRYHLRTMTRITVLRSPRIRVLLALLVGVFGVWALLPESASADQGDFTEVLSVGNSYVCAVTSSGEIACWGYDAYGQVTGAPTEGVYAQVSAGSAHACALTAEGGIDCWGYDRNNEVSHRPATGVFSQVSAGDNHSCAVAQDGGVVCWGYNGGRKSSGQVSSVPFGKYVQVSAGGNHSCGLTSEQRVVCWGYDHYGVVSGVPQGGSFVQVGAGGEYHACALTTGGSVVCWGDDSVGQVSGAPTEGEYRQVVTRVHSSCAVSVEGGILCWGNTGAQNIAPSPRYAYASKWGLTLCSVTTAGAVECFGTGPAVVVPQRLMRSGAIRASWLRGTDSDSPAIPELPPGPLAGDSQADGGGYVSVGNSYVCAVTSSGEIACWGYDAYGQVTGAPTEGVYAQVSAGSAHACALTAEGGIDCWGYDRNNEVSHRPATGVFSQVSAGDNHSCAVAQGGGVVCWGYNGGRKSSGQVSSVPFGKYVQVSAGGNHSCGLTSEQRVVCWGYDHYGVVSGVPQGGSFVQVGAGGEYHACALTTGGSVVCWGDDSVGQVSGAPTEGEYRQVVTRVHSSCAVSVEGGILCWGNTGAQNIAPSPRYAYATKWDKTLCAVTTASAVECFGTGQAVVVPPELGQPGTIDLSADSAGTEPVSMPGGSYALATSARIAGPVGGTVTSTASGSDQEAEVTLTARPDAGYRFVRWEGDLSSTRNPLTLTLSDHVFVTAVFGPATSGGPVVENPTREESKRTTLFASRSLPSQIWQIGEDVNLTLPPAIGGTGFYNYSIKYEWNGDQTWTPAGVSFDRNRLVFSGAPSMTLSPSQALRKFTVFLRVEDRIRLGDWDELEFVVNLIPSPVVRDSSPQAPSEPAIQRPAGPSPQACTPTASRLVFVSRTNSFDSHGTLATTDCESPRFPNHFADRIAFTLKSPSNVLITLTAETRDGAVGSLVLLREDGRDIIAFGDHVDGAFARVERQLNKGTYTIEVNAIEPHPRYRVSLHLLPDGCRTVGPIANGMTFPETNVRIEGGSSTDFRVTGQAVGDDRVMYHVCADNRSLSDDARDKALYTAAVWHHYVPEAEQAADVYRQAEDWVRGKGLVRVVEALALPAGAVVHLVGGDDKNVFGRFWVRLSSTPEGVQIESASELLKAIAEARISYGSYEHWEEDQQFITLTSYVLKGVKVAVLLYTGVGSVEAGLGLASLTLELTESVVDAMVKQPSEIIREMAKDRLSTGAHAEHNAIRWDDRYSQHRESTLAFTLREANEFIEWRSSAIVSASVAPILEELTDSWDDWVNLTLDLVSLGASYGGGKIVEAAERTGVSERVAQAKRIAKAIKSGTSGIEAVQSWYGFVDAVLTEHEIWQKMEDAAQQRVEDVSDAHEEFLRRIGLGHRADLKLDRLWPAWLFD